MGGVNYLLNICRVLRAYTPDIETLVFAPATIDSGLRERIFASNGSPPITLEERGKSDDILSILGWRRTDEAAVFAQHGIDLVFESQGYYGTDPPFPVLSWLPDFQHRRLPHLFPRSMWLAREVRFRRILATRRHILLSSQQARTDAEALYGQVQGKLHVVPFAVRLENHVDHAAGEEARLRFGLPKRFVFLPNQFWAHKNHSVVVEALGLLGEKAPVVAATGSADDPRAPEFVPQLRGRIKALGLTQRFRMLGEIPYDDILALNARADCLLNPSLFEGWSTTVEEAKTLGTPLLLSDIAVHREQAGERAAYFDPTDAAACAVALRRVAAGTPRASTDDNLASANESAQLRFATLLRAAFMTAAR
jgi:glycosyltransferase involved in cell wall biosynthesis